VPVTDVMKLDLKPLDSGSNFRKPKHSRMDFGRICIRGVFFLIRFLVVTCTTNQKDADFITLPDDFIT